MSRDPDGWLTQNFVWKQVSGPSTSTLVKKTYSQSYGTKLIVGTYVFRVTVTDNKGATDYDDVTVRVVNSGSGTVSQPAPTVVNGNYLPIANAGADVTLDLSHGVSQILLNGSLSRDPDGWLLQNFVSEAGKRPYSFNNSKENI